MYLYTRGAMGFRNGLMPLAARNVQGLPIDCHIAGVVPIRTAKEIVVRNGAGQIGRIVSISRL
jgi:hypothetical protein